jgi:Domain of unknown function (DUF4145)
MGWKNLVDLGPRRFTCGFCSLVVASAKGYHTDSLAKTSCYICPNCDLPTLFTPKGQTPGVAPGNAIDHLPKDVEALYDEARNSVAAKAPTAAVLACRKLLMNIAVSLGATTGESFLSYVNYLADKGYVPPNGRGWVDHIRKKSNEANHEILLMSVEDATELITFSEMLLKFIFEFPNRVPAPAA